MTAARRQCSVLVLALGCGTPAPAANDDVAIATRADDCTLVDRSGAASPRTLDDLHDPIARLVLRDGCPQTVAAVLDKLARVDTEGCGDKTGDPFAADRTTMISELAQLRGVGEGDIDDCTGTPVAVYRGVVQHNSCTRPPWSLMLSVAPLATVLDELPSGLEAIAWDPDREHFDFYTLEESRWHFHGSSRDMLRGRGEDGTRRCAACHVAGGLVMKELDVPWLHWEGRVTTPGIDALLGKHRALGSRVDGKVIDFRPAGKELQDAIVAGNAAWVRTRVAHLREHGRLADLLSPLFCTEEINLRAATDTASPPWARGDEEGALEIGAELFVDPQLAGPGPIAIGLADYHAAIAATGQRVEHSCGARLVDNEGRAVIDLPFDLAYPHRAEIDVQHVRELVRVGIVDEAFVTAVLGVDFTRPIFSSSRCGLLERLPELPPGERNAEAIRAAMDAALASAPSNDAAAAELATNLAQPSRVPARVSAFLRACRSRASAELAHDVVHWVSWLRATARERPILEFRETLPVDDLVLPASTHLRPDTCTLATSE